MKSLKIFFSMVVDEGASTCVMLLACWKAICQPELSLLPTLLTYFDGRLFRPHSIIPSFPMQLGGKTVCVEVEVVDAPLDYNILLGWSWTYAMHAVVAIVFRVLCFSHEGRIITIDQLSFSHPDPSSGASTVPMIDNPQPGTVNLGVILFPSLMGTFDYLPPSNDVRFISVVPDQPRAAIFQVSSFKMSYFHDPWDLPSPSASMEGIGHLGMAIPLLWLRLCTTLSSKPRPTPICSLTGARSSSRAYLGSGFSHHPRPFRLIFPSDEVILEAMTGPGRPWDDLHHRSYFLPELRRIEVREFFFTMNGDIPCPINPLATHRVYA
jgi:hypothetical protein